MADQRVLKPGVRPVRADGPKVGPRATTQAPEPEPAPPRRRRGLVVTLLVLALLAVAATAYVFLRPPAAADAAPPEPEPGAVVAVEPVSVNLADDRYLRLGFSMQLTAESHGEIETARALDIAIALFSGRTVEEVNDPAQRTALKADLTQQLNDAFHGEVMAVYLTDFVTQ